MHLSSNNLKRISHLTLIVAALLFSLSGCSYFNETRLENSLGKDVDLIDYSYDIADDLIKSAFPPLVPRQQSMAILTTTFVDNNDLDATSHFGRLLQDNIGSGFAQRGFSVNEIRMREELLIEERSGETMLTRDLNLLAKNQRAQAILVGTISQAQRTMYISARLINPTNNSVISSKNYRLYMDRNVLAMFNLQRGGNNSSGIKRPSEPLMNSVLY